MGNTSLNYKDKLAQVAQEANIHLLRLEQACSKLQQKYGFPIDETKFNDIIDDENDLPLADQIVYRFSKAQDAIGAKLFKAFTLYQGDDTDRPFLDILNSLEKSRVLMVDDWIILRDLRNDISHNYDSNPEKEITILNKIYGQKDELKNIVDAIIKVAGINLGDKKQIE